MIENIHWLDIALLLIYVIMSIATFFAYAYDKKASERKTWRISESTLQIMALCFGWPGALLAQKYLRHKTQKRNFLIIFWGAVTINIMITFNIIKNINLFLK